MIYSYLQYRRYFYIALGWICIYALLRYEEIGELFSGSYHSHAIFLLFFQLIVIPLFFVLVGAYTKSVTVTTKDSGIEFTSWFKKINMKWEEIKSIQREAWWIKIKSEKKASFSVSPFISASRSKIKFPVKGNIYKKCELLKEIKLKALKADVKDFPVDTFCQ